MAIVVMLPSHDRAEQTLMTTDLRDDGHTVHDRQNHTAAEIADPSLLREFYDVLEECEYVVYCGHLTRHDEHMLFLIGHMGGTAKKLHGCYEGHTLPPANRHVVVPPANRHATRANVRSAVT